MRGITRKAGAAVVFAGQGRDPVPLHFINSLKWFMVTYQLKPFEVKPLWER